MTSSFHTRSMASAARQLKPATLVPACLVATTINGRGPSKPSAEVTL